MLCIENLGYKNVFHALHCTFEPNHLYALVGCNGVGKTTLLKLLSKVWSPTSGCVLLHGQPFAASPQTVTLIPQPQTLYFPYTIQEFVTMGAYTHKSRAKGFVQKALEQTHLVSLKDKSMNEISQGERQKAYIARGLATHAPILLFDEPTAHLDLYHQRECWNLLKTIAASGHLLIVVTHDLFWAKRAADQVLVLKRNQLFFADAEDNLEQLLLGPLITEYDPTALAKDV